MANSYSTTKTNYFRVTDEERFVELLSNLTAEDVVHTTEVNSEGETLHFIGGYSTIDYRVEKYDENGDLISLEYDFDAFLKELQKILPEKECMIWTEAGHEKLRDVFGYVVVVTKDAIRSMSLYEWADKCVKELTA